MKNSIIFLLIGYQKIFSPDHGIISHLFPYGFCKFYPSCSSYTSKSIQKYGIIKGFFKGLTRMARCHPWSGGGIDHP